MRTETERKLRKPKLTPQQNAFCLEYVKVKDAGKAYRATYNTKTTDHAVHVAASRLLKKPVVKDRLASLLQKTEARTILSAQQILEELTVLAKRSFQHRDRLKALELLGKYRKLFTEKVELRGADGTALVVASLSERLKAARERSALVR